MHLDRFAYGLPDQQALSEVRIARCCCGEDIHLGDEVISYEDELYCSYRCLMDGIGAIEINAGMGE